MTTNVPINISNFSISQSSKAHTKRGKKLAKMVMILTSRDKILAIRTWRDKLLMIRTWRDQRFVIRTLRVKRLVFKTLRDKILVIRTLSKQSRTTSVDNSYHNELLALSSAIWLCICHSWSTVTMSKRGRN